MNITKRAKIMVGAVAVVGAFAAAGTAFTSSGITNDAGATQFVGGTVSQSVTGATLAGASPTHSGTHRPTLPSTRLC